MTDSRGLKRKSAAATDRGKLLGICDMLSVLDAEDYKSGAQLGMFFMGGYKVGVCIENDLMFPEYIKAMSLCGCNLIAVLFDGITDNMPANIIRTYAYLYGVPIVMCGGKVAYFADISGAIASSNQKITMFEIDPKNCYRIVTTRRKGLWQDYSTDF
jgi:predicted amidohydrolase